jgi:hypothetical protein
MRGIIMARTALLSFAAAALAIAAVSLADAPAQAFTFETLGPSDNNGGSKLVDPDNQVNNLGQSAMPFGPNGPTIQFGGAQQRPFGHAFGPPPAVDQQFRNGNGDDD